MISWASDGGGVGAHVDSYDVFLLQARGTRRWRIARRFDAGLDERAPLKMLRRFAAEQEYALEPGDLLYLPPGWAHEGVAEGGDCMTCSIGMRTPQRGALGAELAQRLAETYEDSTLYSDARQSATSSPAAIPPALTRLPRPCGGSWRALRHRERLGGVERAEAARRFTKRTGPVARRSRARPAHACSTTSITSTSTANPCPSAAATPRCCAR
jgi:hypothetical protein